MAGVTYEATGQGCRLARPQAGEVADRVCIFATVFVKLISKYSDERFGDFFRQNSNCTVENGSVALRRKTKSQNVA